MWEEVLKAIYFAAPAFFAGIAPVIAAGFGWLKPLGYPVDLGAKMGGKPLFGSHKTWRGIACAILAGIAATGVQAVLYFQEPFAYLSLLYYPGLWIAFGALAGLGSILGDLAKSFLKRRMGIASGKPWPIFDQIDSAIGFIVFTYFMARPSWVIILIILALSLIASPITNMIAYLLRIKKVWW